MRKAHLVGIFAVVSTSIVVAAIVGSKCCHAVRSTSNDEAKSSNDPKVRPRATQSDSFGTYSQHLKSGWNRIQYSSVVVFGASDCDDAHPRAQIYANTLRGAPYYHGRYTNGPVFPEYLTDSTLTGHNITLLNYAYGHATVSNELVKVDAPDIKMQIGMYLDDINNGRAQRGDGETARVLHCVWIGKNDIIEIWNNVIQNGTFQNGNSNGESTGFESALKRVQTEANELINQVKSLTSNSKVNSVKSDYLVMLLHPLEIVPNLYYQAKSLAKNNMTLSNMYLKYIGDLTQLYNDGITKGIDSLSQGSGQNYMTLDIPKYWYYIRSHPDQFNFVNVVDACWNSTTGNNCMEPARWQYYDTLHATTKMQEYLAQEITVQVNL